MHGWIAARTLTPNFQVSEWVTGALVANAWEAVDNDLLIKPSFTPHENRCTND